MTFLARDILERIKNGPEPIVAKSNNMFKLGMDPHLVRFNQAEFNDPRDLNIDFGLKCLKSRANAAYVWAKDNCKGHIELERDGRTVVMILEDYDAIKFKLFWL
jgi:hypothetical protein